MRSLGRLLQTGQTSLHVDGEARLQPVVATAALVLRRLLSCLVTVGAA